MGIRYIVTAKENHGGRRVIKTYKTKREAQAYVKKLNSPAKSRIIDLNGKKKKIYLTSYRQGLSGTGINNPRIRKIEVPYK